MWKRGWRECLCGLATWLAIASQPGVDQMLAAANSLEKRWNEDHDAFLSVYRSGAACETAVPERAKRAWATHDASIAAWRSYYDALERSYNAEHSQYVKESAHMDSELTRLRKLRAEENLELIRLKQKASRDTNPLHRQIIPIRERSLSRLDRSLEHIESAKRANANSQARTAELFAYLDHARRTVSLQDSSWDNFYRGQLLSLRAEARVSCPDVFEKHYGAIEPAQ